MSAKKPVSNYKFTFGPWNISTGSDPFGPAVRQELDFAHKIKIYKELGFDGVGGVAGIELDGDAQVGGGGGVEAGGTVFWQLTHPQESLHLVQFLACLLQNSALKSKHCSYL